MQGLKPLQLGELESTHSHNLYVFFNDNLMKSNTHLTVISIKYPQNKQHNMVIF